jgi:hypothetical protein
MAWTSMHFAVGMGCTGLAFGAGCLVQRRGWRWLPMAMTVGGVWALVPDLPRLWREDFPWLPLASTFGSKSLEAFLHSWGNLFWFHHMLDMQPKEFALHGLGLILIFYNVAIVMLMKMESAARNSVGNRAWKAHRAHLPPRAFDPADPPHAQPVRSSHLSRAG